MSLIPLLATFGLGWFIFTRIKRDDRPISPLGMATAFLLGTGAVHGVYYASILLFESNPPPLLILAGSLPGWVSFAQATVARRFSGWQSFREHRRLTTVLVGVVILMTVFTAMTGYYADTLRMWHAKAQLLDVVPSYAEMIAYLGTDWHPEYPTLLTHQYQWQRVFSDTVFGSKLPNVAYYLTTLAGTFYLLHYLKVKQRVMWLIFLAGLPVYWAWQTQAAADLPVSAYVVVGLSWLVHDDKRTSSLALAVIVLGLLPLVKIDGALLIVCIVAAVGIQGMVNGQLRRGAVIGAAIAMSAGAFLLSWLAVTTSAEVSSSDFALSTFDTARTQIILSDTLPTLFDPHSFAGLWIVVFGLLLLGFWRHPLIWFPALAYSVGMLFAYHFSDYGPGLRLHIFQSYERLLMHVTPLAVAYIASGLSGDARSIYLRLSADSPHEHVTQHDQADRSAQQQPQ